MRTINLLIILLSALRMPAQWSPVRFNSDITTACFATARDTCFVTGDKGKIFRTTNGGIAWDSVQTVFKTSWFLDIHFPSKNTGYACGGTAFGSHKSMVAKTLDGGQTWDSIASGLFGYDLSAIYFLDNNTGFIGALGAIIKTTDGGQTFIVDTLPAFGSVKKFCFPSGNTGYAASAKLVIRTTDQGVNWSVVHTDTSAINSVYFVNASTGFAVGDKGVLLRTNNGGAGWNRTLITGDTLCLQDVKFITNSEGYIAASRWQGSRGYIYKTIDGGNNWVLQYTSATHPFTAISMVSPGSGYAAGYSGVNRLTPVTNSLLEEDETSGLVFFPNPVSGYLSVRAGGLFDFFIYDCEGRPVSFEMINNCSGIDTSKFPAGLYTLMAVERSGCVHTGKFVKE